MPLKLIFAGTPHFAATHLSALIDSEHQLVGVYTQPDRPAGRGKKLQASPVKVMAEAAGIPVLQPASLRDTEAQKELAALQADALVVVAYGLILPAAVLQAPRLGCINVHASLLPRWRGAAPIQRAIEAGDSESGITIMQMDEGLDTGDMLASARCEIAPQTTSASLHDTLAELGAPLLCEVLADLPGWQARAVQQDDDAATYADKILKSEAAVDWSRPAVELDRCIRAFNPFPICFTHLQDKRVKIWRARPAGTAPLPEPPGTILQAGRDGILVSCGEGQLLIEQLQLPGSRPMEVAEVLNGNADMLTPGTRFASPVSAE
ncbi:methionyl-tRNA formyltransferase [Pseudohalioglobus sediminis]|uniref:Methionyl-tRNA formyltransferase n=1 Tax=Pseudohalioglobus sediminis TaxID=2606449 RepID=A0A5B0WVZ6_9GAMM|nr:methionyl-tRNA formyltransferase [Pseudohalioglobus sediminis]KAA1190568.1 methionyl-tRNA formyltransferase [Pseudohalioglobus sediminis]